MRVGVLLSHECAHQVAHALPVAASIARHRPDISVEIYYSAGPVEREVRRLAAVLGIERRCRFEALREASPVATWLRTAVGNTVPIERLSMLRRNVDRFRGLSALIVPEKTSLLLKTQLGLRNVPLIHTRHGAGDRAIGFDSASSRFDFVLLSGRKVRDRLLSSGALQPGRHAIVGYPKFDLLPFVDHTPLFANDRPTVLYNPHPAPGLSSWYRMGHAILDYFARSRDFNLIFAPHVMLFRRNVTICVNPPSIGRVPDVPGEYRDLPHVLVDTGSTASIDMRYTASADIYLGDASSQVYEFLVRPRPCVFVDAHQQRWQADPNFTHWRAGAVVDDIAGLDRALRTAVADPQRYAAAQRELFAHTFELGAEGSGDRAARAVLDFLDRVPCASAI